MTATMDTETHSIRLASEADIDGIVELWANSACLKQIRDSIRWDWKDKPSKIWAEFAKDMIKDADMFLVVCDLQINGLSGFMMGRFRTRQPYYSVRHVINIEEAYIRPKDRSPAVFQDMLNYLVAQMRHRQGIAADESITITIDMLDGDEQLLPSLSVRRSSSIYTLNMCPTFL